MITLEFQRSLDLGARLIQLATWSRWDHVGIVLDDGRLLSALPGVGVCVRPRETGVVEFARYDVHGRSAAILRAAERQIGKPYDWSAVFGIGLHRDWREEDSFFFCSELVAWAFEKGGCPLLRADKLNRVTPRDLAMSPLLRPA